MSEKKSKGFNRAEPDEEKRGEGRKERRGERCDGEGSYNTPIVATKRSPRVAYGEEEKKNFTRKEGLVGCQKKSWPEDVDDKQADSLDVEKRESKLRSHSSPPLSCPRSMPRDRHRLAMLRTSDLPLRKEKVVP